jgi:hypothetical protein
MTNDNCVDSTEKDVSGLLDAGEDTIPGMVLDGWCSDVHHTRYYGVCYAGVNVIGSGGFSLSIL